MEYAHKELKRRRAVKVVRDTTFDTWRRGLCVDGKIDWWGQYDEWREEYKEYFPTVSVNDKEWEGDGGIQFNKMLQIRDEVNHLFDGISQRLMGCFINRMTHGERQLFFLLIDAFDRSKTFQRKFPPTHPYDFFVNAKSGKLSRKVAKQCSVPGIMFVAGQALEVVWGQAHILVKFFENWTHLMTAYWGQMEERRPGRRSQLCVDVEEWMDGGLCSVGCTMDCVCVDSQWMTLIG